MFKTKKKLPYNDDVGNEQKSLTPKVETFFKIIFLRNCFNPKISIRIGQLSQNLFKPKFNWKCV